MKLGVMTVLFGDKTLDETCALLKERSVQTLEIGCGGFPGKAHCDPEILLNDDAKLREFRRTVERHGLEICALSAHGNAVHPNKALAQRYQHDFENAVLLAEKLGVETVVTFSGCPGGSRGDKTPNWVTCAWPDDYSDALEYQWKKVLIPYWRKELKYVAQHGVKRVALEMHPGFCVYNPESLLKMRAACGEAIGANLDPSHLFWQQIDPVAAIRALRGAIYHFHAKDTKIDAINTARNGVLDAKHYSDEINRSWIFRTVGYGHDLGVWRDIISALRLASYEGAISIEHEDSLMSSMEGLDKAIDTLKQAMIFEDSGKMFWA